MSEPSARRKEIARITGNLEREKEGIERQLKELYAEDERLWDAEQDAKAKQETKA